MSYIKSCKLSGYKSIKNVSCEFKEGLNILIGNNGSGKSNLLEFIDRLYVNDYDGLYEIAAEMTIEDSNSIDSYKWSVEKRANNSPGAPINSFNVEEVGNRNEMESIEFVSFEVPKYIPVLDEEFNPRFSVIDKRLTVGAYEETQKMPLFLATLFFKYLRLYLEDVNSKKDLNDNYFTNLLDKLFKHYLLGFRNRLINYTPIEDIRFSNSVRVAKIDSTTFEIRNIVFEYMINQEWFSWNALSDGTKRLIYTIVKLERVEKDPNLHILIEEPEIGIHPHQLHLLLTFLKEKSKEQQIIISTHSPQVLDVLGADELDRIKIAEIDYERGTIIRGLTEEEMKKAQQYLQNEGLLSDYWRFSDFQRSKQSK